MMVPRCYVPGRSGVTVPSVRMGGAYGCVQLPEGRCWRCPRGGVGGSVKATPTNWALLGLGLLLAAYVIRGT
jgi:hypothetical protein